jgi:hypothetical protein
MFGCSNGNCSGTCVPGNRTCNGKQPQLCNAAGNYANSGSACATLCVGMGVCGVCDPGSAQPRCASDNKTIQTCNGGQWANGTVCSGACLSGACVDCLPNQTQCNGMFRQVCDPMGHWPTGELCPFGCTPPGTMCDPGPGPGNDGGP